MPDSAGVCVNDEGWITSGVEQNGVGGFRTDAIERKKAVPHGLDVTPVKTGAQNMDWVPAFAGMTTLRDVKGEEETIYVMETH